MKRILLIVSLLMVTLIANAKSYSDYINAARNGNKIAQYNVGYCYEEGNGVAINYEQALYWYRKSADQGFEDAQFKIGYFYHLGKGVKKDYYQAAYWYQKAANQGNIAAKNNLANLCFRGKGVTKNVPKAIRLYREAADAGSKVAQCNLGKKYRDGDGVTKDEYEAYRLFLKSADQGYADAQHEVAQCYEYGRGVSKNEYKAFQYYQKAADQGIVRAQMEVGICYYEGTGVTKNYDSAVKWLRKAKKGMEEIRDAEEARKQESERNGEEYDEEDYSGEKYNVFSYYLIENKLYEAGYELGMCYFNGIGKTRDYQTAVAWFRDAANNDNKDAMYMYGYCLHKGYGVIKNTARAVEWYREAANLSQKDAQYALGICYKNGDGVPMDDTEAKRWLNKAANKGHVDAYYEMGLYCEKTDEIYQTDKAAEWYLKIIKEGNSSQKAKAETRLGILAKKTKSRGGTPLSPKAYDYINHASLTLKAANTNEKIYIKTKGESSYSYKATGSWSGDKLPVGWCYVKRVRDKWEDKYDTIYIKHPATDLTLTPMLPKTGTVYVNSKPSGAKVYIDGVSYGTTPLVRELQIGQHNIWVGGKKRYLSSSTQTVEVSYKRTSYASFKLKKEWYHGSDDHPDHYLEPMFGLDITHPLDRDHQWGIRYGWIPKRFGLDVTAMYGVLKQELSATIGPTFRLTSFDCPLSLQLALGGGAMYRFTDHHITWVGDAALRFGFKEKYSDDKFGWWSLSLGARYYDGRFIPTASISLMPVRALTLAAAKLEDDFPRIYTEMQAGYEFNNREWMMGAQLSYTPGHLGIGTSFMIGFDGGWDVTAGPVFRLTPDDIVLDLQVYQGFGYGGFRNDGFIAETGLRFAFGHDLPYWGLWSMKIGCLYGSGNVGITFGFSLPIISVLGTAGMAAFWY